MTTEYTNEELFKLIKKGLSDESSGGQRRMGEWALDALIKTHVIINKDELSEEIIDEAINELYSFKDISTGYHAGEHRLMSGRLHGKQYDMLKQMTINVVKQLTKEQVDV